MHILTDLGYVGVVQRPSGWWEVQRGKHRSASESLPRALRFVGFQTPEARAIAGSILRRDHPSIAATRWT
jgi:hypothetical protein